MLRKKRTVFEHKMWHRKWLIRFFGCITYPRFNWLYDSEISGTEVIEHLPRTNVLIVSNHQTYFSDALFIMHAFQSAALGKFNNIRYPGFWKLPLNELYCVAAAETVEDAKLTNFMKTGGVLTISRTWREKGKAVKRAVNPKDTENIMKALNAGWVVSFPQGTTRPFVQGRKGTAHIIKQQKPIVVPVVVDGFRRAFDKRGVTKKKKGTTLKLRVKSPLNINYDDPVEDILKMVMDGIEQSEEFNHVKEIETQTDPST